MLVHSLFRISLTLVYIGYPSATMPLSTLKFNNRPFGLFAIARRNDEKMLIRAMSAWENTFPPRRIPPLSSKSKNQ